MTNVFLITGDTFTSREEFIAMGGRWMPHLCGWFVPEDRRDAVERLRAPIGISVTLVSPSGRRPASGPGERPHFRLISSGVYRWLGGDVTEETATASSQPTWVGSEAIEHIASWTCVAGLGNDQQYLWGRPSKLANCPSTHRRGSISAPNRPSVARP